MKMQFALTMLFLAFSLLGSTIAGAQDKPDYIRQLQFKSVESDQAIFSHWGDRPSKYSGWTNHSNRLVPVYTWGIGLESVAGQNSVYRNEEKLKRLYGYLPEGTLNPKAEYFDQTDIYSLQKEALESGKKNVVVIIFDGMDWQTSQAAAIYKTKKVFAEGRGSGLHFLDYRRDESGFGAIVSSPHNSDAQGDVNTQQHRFAGGERRGGYSFELGGSYPWSKAIDPSYLLGKKAQYAHPYTDSAASATSMFSGIKTFNSSINVGPDCELATPIAHDFQRAGYSIGVVSSVPISHATPACAYAHNISRNDYQDISRDLLGLPSVAHRESPLPGVDVLIGCGWGETRSDDRKKQGNNYMSGNKYLHNEDLELIDVANGGKYVIAQRSEGQAGRDVLMKAAKSAADQGHRLFGFFGHTGGHLPYQTADGNYDPTRGANRAERYKPEDVQENPTLADMTRAALQVLEKNEKGFWLTIEAGDVDWASHNNNIDDAIGAVFSGDDAFKVVTDWVEANSSWDETAVILTADHGHMLVLDDLEALTGKKAGRNDLLDTSNDDADSGQN